MSFTRNELCGITEHNHSEACLATEYQPTPDMLASTEIPSIPWPPGDTCQRSCWMDGSFRLPFPVSSAILPLGSNDQQKCLFNSALVEQETQLIPLSDMRINEDFTTGFYPEPHFTPQQTVPSTNPYGQYPTGNLYNSPNYQCTTWSHPQSDMDVDLSSGFPKDDGSGTGSKSEGVGIPANAPVSGAVVTAGKNIPMASKGRDLKRLTSAGLAIPPNPFSPHPDPLSLSNSTNVSQYKNPVKTQDKGLLSAECKVQEDMTVAEGLVAATQNLRRMELHFAKVVKQQKTAIERSQCPCQTV